MTDKLIELRERIKAALQKAQDDFWDGPFGENTPQLIDVYADAILAIPALADRISAQAGGEGGSGFACPICGQETPHHHTPEVVDAYQNKRSRK